MLKIAALLTLSLLTVAAPGCGGNRGYENLSPEEASVLRVENNNIRDMRVYLRPGAGGERFRIGTANGLTTTIMKLPRTMVTGVTQVVFELVPIGGGGRSFSEQITIHEGEEIVLRISP